MLWKIGTAQCQDIQGDNTAALTVISKMMSEADQQNVNFLCFPECFLQGYTLDEATTQTRGLNLESVPFQAILAELSPYNVTIILGVIEEDKGAYFNTAAVIKKGKLLGKYRKVHLFEKNFQAGIDYPVFTVDNLTFGINICYDARFPEGAIEMVNKGAKVIFYPLSNRWPIEKAKNYRDKHIPNLVDRATGSGCWVISSDIIYQDTESIGYGCSAIVSPDGDIAQRITELETGLCTHELLSTSR